MTYISAWKNSSSVFITADSAITYKHTEPKDSIELARDVSTFGEKHHVSENEVVLEKWLKLYNLDDKLILAFAGDVSSAHNFIDNLKEFIKWDNIKGSIEHLAQMFGGSNIVVFAGYFEAQNVHLLSYNIDGSQSVIEHSENICIHAGTPSSQFKEYSSNSVKAIVSDSIYNDQEKLNIYCSLLQSYKFYEDLMPQGVGGFFAGFRVDHTGVSWQNDTSYITYEIIDSPDTTLKRALTNGAGILILARDNMIMIENPFTDPKNARRLFPNYSPHDVVISKDFQQRRMEWVNKWSYEIHKKLDSFDVDYFVFVNRTKRIVMIVSKAANHEINLFIVNRDIDKGTTKLSFPDLEKAKKFIEDLDTELDNECTLYLYIK